ncbi:MAG: rhodanese-like domain-containing protein, partial [Actinomycetota bacterium]
MGTLNEVESKVPSVISVAETRALLDGSPDEAMVLADVRWYLDGRDASQAFRDGHLPGAVFVDVDRDLADHHNADRRLGRHPLPTPQDFARSMARLGIGDRSHVIAYDDTGGMTAARLVVMLRMIGRSASLLDGGIGAWSAEFPDALESGHGRSPATAVFTPTPWPAESLADYDDVRHVAESTDRSSRNSPVLIDARAPDRFEGRAPTAVPGLDPRPGHIPGAVNAPWAAVLDPESKTMRSPHDVPVDASVLCGGRTYRAFNSVYQEAIVVLVCEHIVHCAHPYNVFRLLSGALATYEAHGPSTLYSTVSALA